MELKKSIKNAEWFCFCKCLEQCMCFCLMLDKLQLMSRSLSKCLLFHGIFFSPPNGPFWSHGYRSGLQSYCQLHWKSHCVTFPPSPLEWNLSFLKSHDAWKWSILIPKQQKKLDEELKEIHQSNNKDKKYWKYWIFCIVQDFGCHLKKQQQK